MQILSLNFVNLIFELSVSEFSSYLLLLFVAVDFDCGC